MTITACERSFEMGAGAVCPYGRETIRKRDFFTRRVVDAELMFEFRAVLYKAAVVSLQKRSSPDNSYQIHTKERQQSFVTRKTLSTGLVYKCFCILLFSINA